MTTHHKLSIHPTTLPSALHIQVADCRPGHGKTSHLISEIATKPGLRLIACQRKANIAELEAKIRTECAGGISPTIDVIISPSDKDARGPSVRTLIENAPDLHAGLKNVVVLCTHAGLLAADLGKYDGWHLVIDEVPDIIETCHFVMSGPDRSFLRDYYDIQPTGSGQEIVPRQDLAMSELRASGLGVKFADFHGMVLEGEAQTDIANWHLTYRQEWSAWRIWDAYDRLKAFSGVTIMAAGFYSHLTGLLLARDPRVVLLPAHIPAAGPAPRPRNVAIRYFSEDHRGSAYRFGHAEFATEVEKVADWVASNSTSNHFWSANTATTNPVGPAFKDAAVPGKAVNPKQAGENGLRTLDNATFIYTARPSQKEIAVMAKLGITEAQIIAAREDSDIYQFVLRSSARDPDADRDLSFSIWSKPQADALKARLAVDFPMFSVSTQHIDLNLQAPARSARAKKPAKTVEQKRADAAARKRKSRLVRKGRA